MKVLDVEAQFAARMITNSAQSVCATIEDTASPI